MTALGKPFYIDIGLEEDDSLRIIRERSTPRDRDGFSAPHLDSIVLTRLSGDKDSVARVLMLNDVDGPVDVSPNADTAGGETYFSLPRQPTDEFRVGEGHLTAPGLAVDVKALPTIFSLAIRTDRPLIVVRGSTYKAVVEGARRSNGKHFHFPPLPDIYRGLRSTGNRGQLWHIGLGREIEKADLNENVWSNRLAGMPLLGYRRVAPNAREVERRPGRR